MGDSREPRPPAGIIRIRGFRSLSKVELDLNVGLNVLIGPNGSGKTNLLTALDFISHCVEGTVQEAVEKMGGIRRVFDVSKNINKPHRKCSFGIINRALIGERKKETGFLFNYSFSVHKSRGDTLSRSDESLRVISWNPRKRERGQKYFMRHTEIDQAGIGKYRVGFLATPRRKDRKRVAKILQKALNRHRSTDSLLKRLSDLSIIGILRDLVRHRERLMLDPNIIRAGDGSTSPPVIKPNGEGVVSTLAAIADGKYASLGTTRCAELYEEIKNEIRLAVPGLRDLKVRTTKSGKKTLVFVPSHTRTQLDATQVSEGTLRWLAVVCSIKSDQLYSFEEPENYLHPWMQREFVRLLREREPRWGSEAVILSTHSETILNAIKPEEVFIVRMEKGKTVLARIRDAKTIDREINSTGFGLGHFYVAGAVNNVAV